MSTLRVEIRIPFGDDMNSAERNQEATKRMRVIQKRLLEFKHFMLEERRVVVTDDGDILGTVEWIP